LRDLQSIWLSLGYYRLVVSDTTNDDGDDTTNDNDTAPKRRNFRMTLSELRNEIRTSTTASALQRRLRQRGEGGEIDYDRLPIDVVVDVLSKVRNRIGSYRTGKKPPFCYY